MGKLKKNKKKRSKREVEEAPNMDTRKMDPQEKTRKNGQVSKGNKEKLQNASNPINKKPHGKIIKLTKLTNSQNNIRGPNYGKLPQHQNNPNRSGLITLQGNSSSQNTKIGQKEIPSNTKTRYLEEETHVFKNVKFQSPQQYPTIYPPTQKPIHMGTEAPKKHHTKTTTTARTPEARQKFDPDKSKDLRLQESSFKQYHGTNAGQQGKSTKMPFVITETTTPTSSIENRTGSTKSNQGSSHVFQRFPGLEYAVVGSAVILLMCCFGFLWRWMRRNTGKNTRKDPPQTVQCSVPREERPSFWQRLRDRFRRKTRAPILSSIPSVQEEEWSLINKTVNSRQADFEKSMNDTLKSLQSTSAGSTLRPAYQYETDYEEFAESLKPSEEEVKDSQRKDEDIHKLKEEIRELKAKMNKLNEKHKSENSSIAGNFSQIDEEDEEFRRKMAEQNGLFEETMKKLRERRKERERLAQKELDDIRLETEQRISAIMACFHLKARFQDKEDEWSESLKKLREPLVAVINSYWDLQKEIKDADYTDDFSRKCVDSECNFFAQKLVNAQNMLGVVFDNLKKLTETFENKIFIKIIMKSVSDQGKKCNEVGKELVNVLKNVRQNLGDLNKAVDQLNPHAIPTTSELRKKSVTARNEDFLNIEDVPFPDWLRHFK